MRKRIGALGLILALAVALVAAPALAEDGEAPEPAEDAEAALEAVGAGEAGEGAEWQAELVLVPRLGEEELTVAWAMEEYVITASAGVGGTISPQGDAAVSGGDCPTYTITPEEGYVIDAVTVDGILVGPASAYTFINVREDHVITATFMEAVE